MTRRNVIIGAGALTAVMAGAAGVSRWRSAERAEIISPALQPAPDRRGLRDDVRATIDDALRRAAAGDETAFEALSRLLHANGFLVEAMRCYAVLERLQPKDPRWLHRHATIAAGFGDTEPALARWQRVIALAPDYLPARLRLGELLLKMNRLDPSAAEFHAVLQREPNDPHAALGLARIDIEVGRWSQARERLEKIVAQTDYALGYDLIVSVYEHLGLHAQAKAVRSRTKASGAYRDFLDPWMTELLDVCYDPFQLALASGAAERAGDSPTALRLLERSVELAPEDVAVRFQLAGLHARRRDVKAAREQLERCTVASPEFADGWAHLSALLEQTGDRAAAERTVIAGLRHCPESPGLHLMRARHLRRAGQIGPALESYRRSIQLRANEADAYVERATLLFQAGRASEAVRDLEQALNVEPDHPVALTVLALSAISANDEAAARRWLSRVREQPRIPSTQAQQLYATFREQFRRDFR